MSVLTLSEKLSKKRRVQASKNENVDSKMCADIEDTVVEVKSVFLSPLQTRQQRKLQNKPIKIRELTNLDKIAKTANKAETHVTKEQHTASFETNVEDKIQTKTVKSNLTLSIYDSEDEEGNSLLVDSIWEPTHWQNMLHNIRLMRARAEAPVDTMGCHKCQDKTANRKTQRFQILVALMLSSQTKDEVTHAAVQHLRAQGLTPATICKMDSQVLEKLIHPVGFYKTKAKHLKQTSRILIDQYDSDIPNNITDLMKLPGVGPKMAHLCMSEAWDELTGIGVDVHVHRISNRLNWVPKPTKQPEQTRAALESWLPRSLWREVNPLLVGFGQTICTPTHPKCEVCLNKDICPSAETKREKSKKPKAK